MDPTTVRLAEDTLAAVDNEADERELSRAERIREIVENRHEIEQVRSELDAVRAEYEQRISELEDEKAAEIKRIRRDYEEKLSELEANRQEIRSDYEDEIEDLEQELDAKDARIDELRSELQAANRRIDDVNDVIDETRTIVRTQEREQMLQERKEAVTIFRRAWWAVAGNPHARRAVRDADADTDSAE